MCAGAVAGTSAAVEWAPSSAASSSVGASRSVAFRGAALAVKPLRVCRRREDDGVEFLQGRMQRLTVKASAEDGDGEVTLNKPAGSGKKKKLVISPPKKQRVLLRFLWLEKNIGIALDQVVPGHGTIPLSPYYFWPRKDAWEELKAKLDSKGWISRKRTIILLNQATDIINLWQQNAAEL